MVNTSPGQSIFIIVRLSARPFSGLVGRADYPTVLPVMNDTVVLFPLLFILQGGYKHLGCLISLASQPCSIWTFNWWIGYWGSFWGTMSLASLEGVRKWSGTLWRILSHHRFLRNLLSISFRPIFSVVSALVLGLLFFCALIWRVYLGSCLSPKAFPFSWGSKILGGTAPSLRAMSWDIFYLHSCFIFQWWRRSLGIS